MLCSKSLCTEDRRIKVLDGEETLLCPDDFEGSKPPRDKRMIMVITNLVITVGATFALIFLQ